MQFFSVPLDALPAKTCIQGFQNMESLCCFNLFPSGSITIN